MIMRTLLISALAVALLTGRAAHAQQGSGAANSTSVASSETMAWGFALGGLAVIGVVVGIVAASASNASN